MLGLYTFFTKVTIQLMNRRGYCLQISSAELGGQGLCELVGLARVRHLQGVQVGRKSDLELGNSSSLLDLDRLGSRARIGTRCIV